VNAKSPELKRAKGATPQVGKCPEPARRAVIAFPTRAAAACEGESAKSIPNPSLFQSKDEPGEEPGRWVEEAPFRFRF